MFWTESMQGTQRYGAGFAASIQSALAHAYPAAPQFPGIEFPGPWTNFCSYFGKATVQNKM